MFARVRMFSLRGNKTEKKCVLVVRQNCRSFYLSCTIHALLSPRRKGLPPTSSFAVHPVRDDRGSIRCSTLLPNGKVSVQLLRGSTVWSQTKHRRVSGITSDHRTRLHVVLTSFEKAGGVGRTQKFHILCNLSPSCRFPVCIFSVQTFGLICLFVSPRVFLSNFRTTPLLSWRLYCSNQLVTVTTLMQLVFTVDIESISGVGVMNLTS